MNISSRFNFFAYSFASLVVWALALSSTMVTLVYLLGKRPRSNRKKLQKALLLVDVSRVKSGLPRC